jgi:hypothetical protein
MMKRALIVVPFAAVLLSAGCCAPTLLYLQTPDTREILGPFSLSAKSEFNIREGRYIVVHPTAQQLHVQKVLSATVIPEIEFRGGHNIEGALKSLWRFVSSSSPDPKVTYSLNSEGYVRWISDQPSRPDPFADPAEDAKAEGERHQIPIPALHARDIPLIEAITIICRQTGFQFRIDGNVVRIEPIHVQPSSAGDSQPAQRGSPTPEK